MDQRNNKIQQFNIPPSTAYDSGNRYITSTVHNDTQGIPCQQSATAMAPQPTFHQASLPNQSQQMLLITNGAQNSGNMIMNNQQPSVGYQIRPSVVTLRTETNYFGQQGPTAVHTNYITPSPQQPVNTNYASNPNPLISMNNMIAGTVSSVNTINNPNADGMVPRTVPQNQTSNVNLLSSSINPLNKTEAINSVNGNVLLPRTVPQNQTSNVNSNIKQILAAPPLRLPVTTSNKVPENLIRLQKFLKQIVADKHDISQYLIEGTVDNLNLIAILCHPKFRSEFLRLSNNERLKMQIRNRMMKESGKIISAHPGPLNTVKSKSIQNILDTLLALTWIHPNSGGPNSTKTRQHQDSRYPPQAVYKNNVSNNSITSQPITSQNQPHHSNQQVSQSQLPVKVAQSNVTSNVRVKKEPGLETAKSSNCSGSGSSFSTGDQRKSLAQPTAPDSMYANFEDFVRMSDEAAEPIDSMFEPIIKENSNQRDVKPVVSSLLNSAAVAPKVPSTNSVHMNTNVPEPTDIKPVINPKTLPNHHPPVTSSSSSQKLQSTMPNSNNLVQLLQSQTGLKPNFAKPYIYSPLPENQTKVNEKQMTPTAPLSSTSDNFLKSLEELQKNAFDSLEATSDNPPFPQVRNQNVLNTNPAPSLPPSQARNLSSIPIISLSVISSVASSPLYTSSVLTPLRDKKKDMLRPLSPNNMCRVEAEDQKHICSSLVESNLSDKKMQDLIKVKKGEVICSLSSKLKPNPDADVPPVNCERSHFWCNFCVYQTDNKLRLVNHVIAAHRFSCQFCKFQCFSRAEVFEHTVSHHQQASQMSKEFKLCVLLPDYLKALEKIEYLENDNFETEFIQSMRKKVRAGPSFSSNSLESDWEDEFLEDETESDISDIESDNSTKKKGRKRKKTKSYLHSDDEPVQNEHEKKKSISKAFKELQRRRKMKKITKSLPNDCGDAEICSDASLKSTSVSPKPNFQGSTKKLKNKRDKQKKVKAANAKVNKKRPSRMTAGKRTNDGSSCFMALEAILSGEENQMSDQNDDDDARDADFVPDSDSEKNKKRKLSDSSPVQLTKTPRVVLTKFNLLKRCIHCDYSSGEIQAIKLHSLDEHAGLFLGVWQDSLDIVLYICPNRFCDFYGSSFNDYLNHLEKCSYDSTDDILESVAQTKKYIKCLKDKRIVKPTKLDSMRQMIVKCLEADETLNTSTASTAVVENNTAAKTIETTITAIPSTASTAVVENNTVAKTTITAIPSNSSVVDMDTTSTSTDNSKPTTNKAVSKDIGKPIKVSKDINSEETVFKCAFCSFKATARPLGVRNHTVKSHPELPLYAINLKCVEEGRDNRFVLFCVGVDCTAEFLESSDYFKHIETCDAVKKLTDDTQLLKTNKFVKSTIHRL